jgi:HKD family nuclease
MTGTVCGHPSDKAVVIGLPLSFDFSKRLRTAQVICLATAFARDRDWKIIKEPTLQSSANIKIITGLYCSHTEPPLLREWLKLMGERKAFSVRLASSPDCTVKEQTAFHPKVLIVFSETGCFAIVGSGNLTSGGLRSDVECSIYTDDAGHVDELLKWFQEITADQLSETVINEYEVKYNKAKDAQSRSGSATRGGMGPSSITLRHGNGQRRSRKRRRTSRVTTS